MSLGSPATTVLLYKSDPIEQMALQYDIAGVLQPTYKKHIFKCIQFLKQRHC